MNNTKNEKKHTQPCSRCRYYTAYYIKGFCKFLNANQGLCSQNQAIVSKDGTCKLWQKNNAYRARRMGTALKSLDETLLHLVELKQIILENEEAKNQ